jgi:hypothetical protein
MNKWDLVVASVSLGLACAALGYVVAASGLRVCG